MKHEVKTKNKNGRNCIKTSLNKQRLTNIPTFSKNNNREILQTSADFGNRFVNQSKGLSLNPGLQHIFITITNSAIITRTILSGN
jgi:hypothetical protein